MSKAYSKKNKFGLRLDDEIIKKIKYISEKTNKPVNSIIESYLIKYIEKYEEKYGIIPLEEEPDLLDKKRFR